ncbi:MAG: ArsA family ATPase [Gammaproteobacteria bacterium]|nr:arsenic-transporting ATPase [Gammaproteobacteria bacterium]MDP6098113.1 ArsA family ATPase [Gammaproteobacteria bacterium]MDP7455864.1 ArsA family ATPase [Gammaproteobacteria bacterium]HJO10742.1 ArsA family ATPase [Gammaproteobacteria bacterium]
MLLELARDKQILFFGGKGGVGKTTVSSATALAMANEGLRVLLVSTDPAHNLGHLFDRTIGAKTVKLAAGLDGVELDPEETVKIHMEEVTRSLHQLMPIDLRSEVDKHMSLSRDAPGMQEAAIFERMAEIVNKGVKKYDLIVFDTAPSGHTARLMVLPEMMSAWTEGLIKRREKADKYAEIVRDLGSDSSMGDKFFGNDPDNPEMMRESGIRSILNRRRLRFAGLRDSLADGDKTSFVIVLAAERLPVLETIELNAQLDRAGVTVGGLVVNKRVPIGMGEFLEERRSQEEKHLKLLEKELPELARHDLFLVSQDVVGLNALEKLAKDL